MKAFAQSTAWFLLTMAAFYLPLSFSALSLNPFAWNHTERFLLAMFIWVGVIGALLKKYIPKPVYKP